ncbi:tripartite tricarboxylate transporter substrate-binding protein [Variovorax ginsengisoli]|uniref:Tripartite tricarboxylate transporter substrate-binding protein n=1 Tax=Variovorax ginsengisoli TaxID=363844 RepID=A0ABT8SGN3_9BURK|nr:tripartite tricarboxylate transporter substrate-binding protein [Variovorax ginsengisoli]MDN8618343.1 tripartite tricarboxylate transporter substrate-binding protein [Variovorax ginsengisoli]MDO1537513.1 tripartite tricarboxylate transporter substrate-binding protein [Variovorax ginsengisoli]
MGLVAPRKMPPAVLARLQSAFVKASTDANFIRIRTDFDRAPWVVDADTCRQYALEKQTLDEIMLVASCCRRRALRRRPGTPRTSRSRSSFRSTQAGTIERDFAPVSMIPRSLVAQLAPAGTPPDVVDQLSGAVARTVNSPDLKAHPRDGTGRRGQHGAGAGFGHPQQRGADRPDHQSFPTSRSIRTDRIVQTERAVARAT